MHEHDTPKTIKEPKLKLALELLDKNILSSDDAYELARQLAEWDEVDDFTLAHFSEVYTEARKGENLLKNVSILLDEMAARPETVEFVQEFVEELRAKKQLKG